MKTLRIRININAAKKALQNNKHVEYFIYCCSKNLAQGGKISVKDLKAFRINPHTINHHLNSNEYYNFSKEHLYLKSYLKLQPDYDHYLVDFEEITQKACRPMNKKRNVIKTWDATNIKYFLLSVVACHKGDKAPYALSLISEDTGHSKKTIQRALLVFDVIRTHRVCSYNSPRGYHLKGAKVNLTANFNKMPIGMMNVKA